MRMHISGWSADVLVSMVVAKCLAALTTKAHLASCYESVHVTS